MTKKKDWRDKGTFGPAVSHEQDGSFVALCTWCVFRRTTAYGKTCSHSRHSRTLPQSDDKTPDWCEMRDDMIADAKKMATDAKQS